PPRRPPAARAKWRGAPPACAVRDTRWVSGRHRCRANSRRAWWQSALRRLASPEQVRSDGAWNWASWGGDGFALLESRIFRICICEGLRQAAFGLFSEVPCAPRTSIYKSYNALRSFAHVFRKTAPIYWPGLWRALHPDGPDRHRHLM